MRRDTAIRALLAAQTATALLVAPGLIRTDTGDKHTFTVVAGIVVAVSGALHAVAAARYRPDRTTLRRLLVGGEFTLLPAQFALSVASDALLAGLALSVALLGALRPRFGRMRPTLRKSVLTLHVGVSVGWLGSSLCMLALSLIGLLADDAGLRHNAYVVMHIFDLAVVIPLVVLSIVTGLIVSLGTVWGLVRHWWVLAKFVLTLAIPFVAGLADTWIQAAADRTAADPTTGAAGSDHRLVGLLVLFAVVLWTTTLLSVFKPWGRTRWAARRGGARSSAAGRAPARATTAPAAG